MSIKVIRVRTLGAHRRLTATRRMGRVAYNLRIDCLSEMFRSFDCAVFLEMIVYNSSDVECCTWCECADPSHEFIGLFRIRL